MDNFNHVALDVLSVIANQIQIIHDAVRLSQSQFTFDGVSLNLDSNFAIFTTLSSSKPIVRHANLP